MVDPVTGGSRARHHNSMPAAYRAALTAAKVPYTSSPNGLQTSAGTVIGVETLNVAIETHRAEVAPAVGAVAEGATVEQLGLSV